MAGALQSLQTRRAQRNMRQDADTYQAKAINFNDDNMLKFWIPGAAPEGAPSIHTAPYPQRMTTSYMHLSHKITVGLRSPILGAPTVPSWPRGLTLLSHQAF